MRSYRSELVSGHWFGRELIIFEWYHIPEWHSECNTIPICCPVTQPLTKAVVQTSINKLNVFKSFQLMLAPPSTLLSNTMDFARINARSFKDMLASMSSDYMYHHSSNIKTNSFLYESMTRDQVHQKRQTLSQNRHNKPDSSPKAYGLHMQ